MQFDQMQIYVPRVDLQALPDEEREAAKFIQSNLDHMRLATEVFADCLSLLRFLQARDAEARQSIEDIRERIAETTQLSRWWLICLRNGAIEVNGFWQAILTVSGLLGKAPTLRGSLDQQQLKYGKQAFTEAFPEIASVRHAAAHPGELSGKPAELAKHVTRGAQQHHSIKIENPEAGLFMSGSMTGTLESPRFTATFNGNLVSYELSEASLQMLMGSALEYWRSFYPAEPEGSGAWQEKLSSLLGRSLPAGR